jgi:hypothetical protein
MNVQQPSGDGYIFPDTLTATVLNTEHPFAHWQVTCNVAQCGGLAMSPEGGVTTDSSTSGQPIYYFPFAPGVITVTFTASALVDPTKTASMTITRGDPTVMTFDSVPTSLAVGSSGAVSELLTSDPSVAFTLVRSGHTWTVTCGSKDCGKFSNSPKDPSGNVFSSDFTTAFGYYSGIQYSAPATVPSGGTVTIKVTVGAGDPSQPSATAAITITPQ